MKSAVSVNNLKKKFPTKEGFVHALSGVTLEVPKNAVFGFLGPNGAGKTTTLRILTTLLPSDEGEAIVAGFDVNRAPEEVRRRIGYVSQKGGADRRTTGWDNLILQGRLYGLNQEESVKQAKTLIEIFSLSECINRLVSTYSGGQQRRLDIALGMMHRPEILFLDEPTTGLDPQNRANLWEKIIHLKEEGVTIFLTSHYLDEVDFLSDTLAIMDHGKIVATGSPNELKKQISGDIVTIGIPKLSHPHAVTLFQNPYPFIRETVWENQNLRLYVDQGESALPHILRLLDQANISLEKIHMSVPTLNDVFLKKTGRSLREGELNETFQ